MVPPLGWKTASPEPISSGNEYRSSSAPELAVVPALGLLQPVQVFGQGLLGLPRRPVDPLELGPLLVAAPVGPGHPHQLEVPELAGRRHVGPPAQVGEPIGVPIGRDRLGSLQGAGRPGVHLVGPPPDGLDDLALERLVAEERQAGVDAVLVADERLVLGHDLAHGGLDPFEVLVAEPGPAGQLEVVVEAVLDHRADGEVGPRPQPGHRLGHDVGGRVPQHLATGVGVGGDHRHGRPVEQRGREVDLESVDGGRHGRLGQPPADRLGQRLAGRPGGQLLARAVGEVDCQGVGHGGVILAWSIRSSAVARGLGRAARGRRPVRARLALPGVSYPRRVRASGGGGDGAWCAPGPAPAVRRPGPDGRWRRRARRGRPAPRCRSRSTWLPSPLTSRPTG